MVASDDAPDESLQWFSLSLGDGIMAAAACEDIAGQFLVRHRAAGRPANMAVFKRHDSDLSLHCEVTAYFSPAAVELARAFGATPCIKPSRRGLDLVAGDPACWPAVFRPD